ncbi:hypothetical protein [Ralstonia solanacearum]|uniref:hypothetical protein n=1 Tax=Ralstonia solanacearum TaxID=305 RepID=UPI000A10EF1B|nr:hypothetical protein [Ralstonia solanacearum]
MTRIDFRLPGPLQTRLKFAKLTVAVRVVHGTILPFYAQFFSEDATKVVASSWPVEAEFPRDLTVTGVTAAAPPLVVKRFAEKGKAPALEAVALVRWVFGYHVGVKPLVAAPGEAAWNF